MIVRRELSPKESLFRLPSEAMRIEVTPDMASDWLANRNFPGNRKMSNIVSERYRKDMENGRWLEETPQGYSFDTDGWLLDGQHRLRAQANAGVTLKVWVFPNTPHETFGVFDAGYRRTPAHLLQMPYSTMVATGARYLSALGDRDLWSLPRFSRIGTQEILETVEQWPELARYGEELNIAQRRIRLPSGPHSAVLAMAARTEHEARLPEWVDGISTGEGLLHGDPRLVLRERYAGGFRRGGVSVPPRDMHLSFLIKSWNAFVTGGHIAFLRHAPGEILPTVIGFNWDNPAQLSRRLPDGNLDDA